MTLLHIAAYTDSLDAFICLINEYNFKIDTQTPESLYPLHYAIFHNSYEVFCYIMSVDSKLVNAKVQAKYNIISLCAYSNNLYILQRVIDAIDPITLKGNQGPAIRIAITSKNVEILKILLKSGSKENTTSSNERSPIISAIISRFPAAVPLLVEAGEDPSEFQKKPKSEDWESPLSYACRYGFVDCVRYLCSKIEKIEPSDEDKNYRGKSAVHWGCESQNPEILQMILEKNNVDVNRIDTRGRSGAHYIEWTTSEETIIAMLEILDNKKFDFNIVKEPDESVLFYFVSGIEKKYKVIEWLVQHGAKTDFFVGRVNETIDQFAIRVDPRIKEIFDLYGPKDKS